MVIRITRSLILPEVVSPEGEVVHRRPVFTGQRLFVSADYDETEEYDWLAPVEGGLMPLPPDAWEVAAA